MPDRENMEARTASVEPDAPGRPSGWGWRVFLFVLALALAAHASRSVLLKRYGREAEGAVIRVDKRLRRAIENKYNYTVLYTFREPSGELRQGSAYCTNIVKDAAAPKVGDTLAIRYFRFSPGINTPESLSRITFANKAMLAVSGVLLIMVFARRRLKTTTANGV